MKIAGEALNGRTGHEAGRALLERLYREETGEDCPEIAIADRGKPYFLNSTWHFSISHTKRHVFCALAEKPVGLANLEIPNLLLKCQNHRIKMLM